MNEKPEWQELSKSIKTKCLAMNNVSESVIPKNSLSINRTRAGLTAEINRSSLNQHRYVHKLTSQAGVGFCVRKKCIFDIDRI